jgi:hypothetical protein
LTQTKHGWGKNTTACRKEEALSAVISINQSAVSPYRSEEKS